MVVYFWTEQRETATLVSLWVWPECRTVDGVAVGLWGVDWVVAGVSPGAPFRFPQVTSSFFAHRENLTNLIRCPRQAGKQSWLQGSGLVDLSQGNRQKK